MPTVKLLDTHVKGKPGDQFHAFGHLCVIQPNLEAHCEMHPDFLPKEIEAGRFALVEKTPAQKAIEGPLDEFGFDIGNYYGAGDLDKLYNKIDGLTKEFKAQFALTRLKLSLPPSMSTLKMTREIMLAIENARAVQEESDE